jgi:energy-coupling factor transport system substrate-specific component
VERLNRYWQSVGAGIAALILLGIGTLQGWAWYTTVVTTLTLGSYALLTLYESLAMDPKYIAFVATLSAIAAVSRTAVQGIPGVQPATFLVIISGYVFGPVTGAAVGAFTAIGSNLFLGEGGWTPWQMLAWGSLGMVAGALQNRSHPRFRKWTLRAYSGIAGYAFGWIMNLWSLFGTGTITLHTYLVLCAASVWFDTLHAVTTVLLMTLAGPPVYLIFIRFRNKLVVTKLP